jgi:hypothetical protein
MTVPISSIYIMTKEKVRFDKAAFLEKVAPRNVFPTPYTANTMTMEALRQLLTFFLL